MRTRIWIGALAVLAVYTIHAFATLDRRDDRAQITSLIQDAAAAGQAHDLGGAISCISPNYKDGSGMNYDRLRALVVQAMKSEPDFKVDAALSNLRVKADKSTASLRLTLKRPNGETIYQRSLTLTLRKENTRHAMILPAKVWRVTNADNLGFSPTDAF